MGGFGGWRQREEMAKQEIFADILNKEESSVQGFLKILCAFSDYLDDKFKYMPYIDLEFTDIQAKRIEALVAEMADRDVEHFHVMAKMKQEGAWDRLSPLKKYQYRTSLGLSKAEEKEICAILVAASIASVRENKKDRRRAIGPGDPGREGPRAFDDVLQELESAMIVEGGGGEPA